MNPAVTMAFAVAKDFPWKRLPVYWFAQYLGALAASGTVLGVYYGNFLLKYFEFIGWNPMFALSVLRVIL